MAAGSYQLIWVVGSSGSGGGAVALSQIAQTGATTGQAIIWNGSAWAPGTVSGSGGGVLNSLSGDVSTGTVDGSGNAPTTVNYVAGVSASLVGAAGTAVGSATNANAASTLVKRDASGNFNAGIISATLAGNATTATTASALSGSINLNQLNQNSAVSGQAVVWNGTAWAPGTVSGGGGSGITQLNGDVTTPAASSGNTTATVASVGGSSASAVNGAVTTVAAATSSGTANTLVKRDGTGAFGGTYSGTLNLSQLTQSGASPNQAILWNGTAWGPYSLSVITSLTGDVTTSGTGAAAATVVSVGGSSASAINTAAVAANAATNANTPSTIVKRDASGNFSAGTITANLSGNATTATSYTGTVTLSQLAQTSATTNQVIAWNGTAWAPATVIGGGGGITALTGDVTASGSGSVAATVVSVGGSSASSVNSATVAANAAASSNTVSVIAARDATGAIYQANPNNVLSSATLTVTAATSGQNFIAYTGSSTVTLIPNPANISYKYTFIGIGGTITVQPPGTGTTPTLYYWGSSTTSSITCNNSQTANYIECYGIPGTSNYVLTNIQGNWQSAGNPIGVYSAVSYPSTSGYVLTANGNTGLADWASAPSPAWSYVTATATAASFTTGRKYVLTTGSVTMTLATPTAQSNRVAFQAEGTAQITINTSGQSAICVGLTQGTATTNNVIVGYGSGGTGATVMSLTPKTGLGGWVTEYWTGYAGVN